MITTIHGKNRQSVSVSSVLMMNGKMMIVSMMTMERNVEKLEDMMLDDQ